MGNRVSIAFKNRGETSVVLFNHWGGTDFVSFALRYLEDLRGEIETTRSSHQPLGRLEPATVMVDFVRFATSGDERVMSDLYLARTPFEGDNTDNGHFEIDVATGRVTHQPP